MNTFFFKFKPHVTEKSSNILNSNKFTFIVDKTVNKTTFSTFIEQQFNVKVLSINTLNLKSKTRRRGKITGSTVARKKIILTIDSKSNLEQLKSLF